MEPTRTALNRSVHLNSSDLGRPSRQRAPRHTASTLSPQRSSPHLPSTFTPCSHRSQTLSPPFYPPFLFNLIRCVSKWFCVIPAGRWDSNLCSCSPSWATTSPHRRSCARADQRAWLGAPPSPAPPPAPLECVQKTPSIFFFCANRSLGLFLLLFRKLVFVNRVFDFLLFVDLV